MRISKDRDDETSTTTQQERIHAHCLAQGWEVIDVIVESGRSAFKASRSSRPGFRKATRLIEAGAANTLLVWKLDRACRDARDTLNLVHELEQFDAAVASVTEPFDTATPTGKLMMTMLAALAEMESATKSDRVTDWHEHRRARGDVPTGRRPYGYRRERNALLIDDDEAAVIDKTAHMIIERAAAGEEVSLRAIVDDLNERGVTNALGQPWSRRGLAHVLTSPTTAGLRELDGVLLEGSWKPVLEREVWDAVRAILRDPARRTGPGNERRWMLTGIATCATCRVPMSAKPHKAGPRYACPSCHLSIECARTDEAISRDVVNLLDGPQWTALRRRGRVPHIDDAALDRELAALAQRYGDGEIKDFEWDAAREGLLRRAKQARQEPVVLPDVAHLRPSWGGFDVTAKRLVIAAAVSEIVVQPARRGTNSFDEQRLDPAWRI